VKNKGVAMSQLVSGISAQTMAAGEEAVAAAAERLDRRSA